MTLKLSFGGCVFDDLDANGIVLQQDANGNYTDTEEPGLAGVTVRLVDANGSPVAFFNADGESVLSTTTDSRGFYKIFGLAEGSAYKIQFDYGSLSNAGDLTLSPPNVVEPAFIGQGGSEGKDSDAVLRLGPTTVETELVIAGSGASNKVNLGLIKPDGPADPGNALLGNQVFEDANRNGLFDRGEVGVAGVQVTLDGAGADGIFGTGDDISRTTVTRNGGVYDFRNLDAGDYKVTFDQPDGFEFTQANVGTNEGKDSDADVNTGMTDVISLVASERNFKVDAGLVRSDSGPVDPTDARLGNRVFLDANRNGRQDVGEAGVGNVQVTLAGAGTDGVFGTGDDVARTTTTDQSGLYRFDSLAAGDYKVTFDQLDGFEFTQANIGSESGDSDADITTGMTDVVSLAASETNLSVDAGLVSSGPVDPQNAKLGNQVFEDANANGILDRGEAGVAGVQVTLDGAGADGVFGTGDDISEVTTTNANGTYSFRNLAAGDYKVTFDNPDGFEFTQANVGTNEGKDSDADVNTGMTDIISLAASERNFKVDAGLIRTVAPNTAPDANNDSATTDFGSPVTIDVLGNDSDPDGDPLTVSSLNGQSVEVGQSVDVGNGIATLLANGQIEFKPDAGFSGNESFSYHVTDGNGGEATADVDVTVAPQLTASIGNRVWNDANGNGIQDANEEGVANVEVQLRRPDLQFISSVRTDANGNYSFDNLDAGDYLIDIKESTLPDGFVFTTANQGTDDSRDSDVINSGGWMAATNLSPGETDNSWDAGIVRSKIDVDLAINYEATNVTATRYASPGFQYNPDIAFPYDVMRYDVTITNQSNETATGIVAKAFVPENIDLWQPGQTRSDTGYSWNQYFDFSPYVWSGGFSGHPGFVDSTNGNVDITDPGTASVGRKLRNQTYGLGEGSVVWELGDSLEAGESATLSFFGMRELRNGYDFNVGTQFFTKAVIHAVDQHDTNSANDIDSTRSWWISPLALDLDGDGVQTLSIDEGIKFDMLNTGTAVNTGWLSGGDGFLAVDNDGDGFIASRDELFGGGIGDGFAKLASYDSNGDGWVNAQDSAFSDLSIWQDANSNGITDAGELATLASHGVTDLNTSYTNVFSTDAQGNVIGEVSSARTASGDNMSLVDVYFQVGV